MDLVKSTKSELIFMNFYDENGIKLCTVYVGKEITYKLSINNDTFYTFDRQAEIINDIALSLLSNVMINLTQLDEKLTILYDSLYKMMIYELQEDVQNTLNAVHDRDYQHTLTKLENKELDNFNHVTMSAFIGKSMFTTSPTRSSSPVKNTNLLVDRQPQHYRIRSPKPH